ncbi:DNA helicase Pif1-like [Dillenia turbinata]|uniref:DNA helicase Pif1-like n=1 Tax=Dillenia turbinata TaxID=194707 RepID=A0AAN8VDH4_9MAGN
MSPIELLNSFSFGWFADVLLLTVLLQWLSSPLVVNRPFIFCNLTTDEERRLKRNRRQRERYAAMSIEQMRNLADAMADVATAHGENCASINESCLQGLALHILNSISITECPTSSFQALVTNTHPSMIDQGDTVFPFANIFSSDLSIIMNRAILTTKNDFVDQINNIMIQKLPGETIIYLSFDETVAQKNHADNEDFLHNLHPSGLPPHELVLKLNFPIMLLRNLNPAEGLCNGTRMLCLDFNKNVIHAKITVGNFTDKQVFIPRIPLNSATDQSSPVPFRRTQFPIRLYFAMTINKAQGQTLDFVGLYLKEPVFSHGQLYVALSRAKTAKHVKILIRPAILGGDDENCTRNIFSTMENRCVFIEDLKLGQQNWYAKLFIVEKSRIFTSKGNAPYQQYLFGDSKGQTIQAVAQKDDVEYLSNLLQLYHTYYIGYANVTSVDDKKLQMDLIPYQLNLNRSLYCQVTPENLKLSPKNYLPLTSF